VENHFWAQFLRNVTKVQRVHQAVHTHTDSLAQFTRNQQVVRRSEAIHTHQDSYREI
jgi:hypothetical protein